MSFKTWQKNQLELQDPRAMRALAHPTRIDLLRVLGGGARTATECAEATGDSPQSCSYHLRLLAKYGFVERAEAPNGKERPWRKVKRGVSWSAHVDPDAARALSTTFIAHDFQLLQRYVADPDSSWPEPMYTQLTLRLSYSEAEQLASKLFDLFEPYFADNRKRAPADAKDVWWSSFGVPY